MAKTVNSFLKMEYWVSTMGSNLSNIMFSIIRSIFDDEPISVADKGLITEDDLSSVLKVASSHDLTHLIAYSLKKNQLFSGKFEQQYETKMFQAVYRYEKMQYEIERISASLEQAKIPFMALKGAVIRKYYPEPWTRTSCDIDILVHEEDFYRAVEALVSDLDYRADSMVHYHDISLFSRSGVHVELHFSIKEKLNDIDNVLSKVWDYSYKDNNSEFHYYQTPEFFVFYHIAHMAHHFIRGGCGVKPFVDMYIIQNKMKYDETMVRKLCRDCGIEKFYDNILQLTEVWFFGKEHTSISMQIENYIFKGGVYGTLENKVTVSRGKKASKVKYALSRIFVSYDLLKDYYLILQKHKWLFPFMQVRRWFSLICGGRLKYGIREMKVNRNISQDNAENMSNFMENVGL